VQELREWQREWRDENRAKMFGIIGDTILPTDDTPSTPPPDTQENADDSTVEVPRAEDTEDKTDEKDNTERAEDTMSPSENARRLESGCVC